LSLGLSKTETAAERSDGSAGPPHTYTHRNISNILYL